MLHSLSEGGGFPQLTAALREIGLPEDALDIMNEYLDTEKPRNDALLDAIKPEYYQSIWDRRQKLCKAQKRELVKADNAELRKRWHLFAYAAGGNDCFNIGFQIEDIPYAQFEEDVTAAFRERFGSEWDARYYAIWATERCRRKNIYILAGQPKEKPELCLRAMEFLQDETARLLLVIYILDQCEPPEKKRGLGALFSSNKLDPHAEAALLHLKGLIGNIQQIGGFGELLGIAAAEAACFSPDWANVLQSIASARKPIGDAALRLRKVINAERIFDRLDELTPGDADYIKLIANTMNYKPTDKTYQVEYLPILSERDTHLERMAAAFPDVYKKVIYQETEPDVTKLLGEIYEKAHPGEKLSDLQERVQKQVADALCADNQTFSVQIQRYLAGDDPIEKLLEIFPQLRKNPNIWNIPRVDYIKAYGIDAFAERSICVQAMFNYDSVYVLNRLPGFWVKEHEREFLDILDRNGVPMQYLLNACAKLIWDAEKEDSCEIILKRLIPRAAEVSETDPKTLCTEGRALALRVLRDAGNFAKLFDYADDSSKAVRAALCDVLPLPGGEWDAQILALLKAKKLARREIAVTLLEKNFPDSMRESVREAFACEKNAGLQTRFAVLLGEAAPVAAQEAVEGDLVKTLTKGNKAKKVEFLFNAPFSAVRKSDGSETDEMPLKALAVSYAEQSPAGRSRAADQLAEGLNTADLEKFAAEVFARWIAQGAPAKTKWVLYLTAIHGGMDAVTSLQHYIKEWAEHSRGAIAAEAVNALAMNSSSPALMAVDNMARKFKNKQVRAAAGNALQAAADALGITREELADKIVPDLGFDENRCRVFDFGERQFQVYLTPALELEIFEGDKKLKNLPKPGAKDDSEKAEAASKDFKEMKKQMKAAVQSQGQRLEYVLLCDRKWTAEGWRELFIRKPVMHCFAIGLIWGVYEDGSLVQSFRFMEDGSFNTPDEDEYELPENAMIGLVHPLELDDDTLKQWQEQLADYEIKQPFPQLTRTVYRVTDAERKETKLTRFNDRELSGMTLLSRMTKLGWDKGRAEDAGFFYDFNRTDIARQTTTPDGIHREGNRVKLAFSGMYIGGYMESMDDVEVGDVEFYDLNQEAVLPLGEITPRYFSEIVYQLTSVLGAESE